MEYKEGLNSLYWAYQKLNFPNTKEYFESDKSITNRPPVFIPENRWLNIIFNPDAGVEYIKALLEMIPQASRHRWFGSFNSSQALTLSILGNLRFLDLDMFYLNEVVDDEYNEGLFSMVQPFGRKLIFEYEVDSLNEKRKTSIDALLKGDDYNISIECKFIEEKVGSCSRPTLTIKDANYLTDYCNGSYTIQQRRKERCTLTEIGTLYWKYIPRLFNIQNDLDYAVCPLNTKYQLVRNILAACIKSDGTITEENGHALLLYDERNPAFQDNGDGTRAYIETKEALIYKKLLRKCSWQKILNYLRTKKELDWLTAALKLKYGL